MGMHERVCVYESKYVSKLFSLGSELHVCVRVLLVWLPLGFFGVA